LGARLLAPDDAEIGPGGLALSGLGRIDTTGLDPRLRESRFEVAIDVKNPLTGPEGASAVYGPQKGASPEQVKALDAALTHYSEIVRRDLGIDVAATPGAGAAGGLAAGLIAFCGATLQPGAGLVARTIELPRRIAAASLVLTGEGSLDGQTLYGKSVLEVVRLAAKARLPVIAFAGQLSGTWRNLLDEGLTGAFCILPGPMSLTDAFAQSSKLLATTAEQVVRVGAAAGWTQASGR
jgi:glycerate kinase